MMKNENNNVWGITSGKIDLPLVLPLIKRSC